MPRVVLMRDGRIEADDRKPAAVAVAPAAASSRIGEGADAEPDEGEADGLAAPPIAQAAAPPPTIADAD